MTWSFLSTVSSATKGTFGILGNIINTLYIVVITLLIATPIGVGSAVYLNEYAKPGKIVRLIVPDTDFNDPSTDHKNHPGSIKDRS